MLDESRHQATIADVEWLDSIGDTQICGHRFTRSDVTHAEEPGDRRPDGRLTVEAKEKIAIVLSGDIQRREHYSLREWIARNPGLDPVVKDCDG